MDGVPSSLPSIVKAHRIQDKARNVGFDWEERSQVWDKVQEEFKELKAEVEQLNADQMEAEFGDLFFSLINAARLYKINPANALERTNQKFMCSHRGEAIDKFFEIPDRHLIASVVTLHRAV